MSSPLIHIFADFSHMPVWRISLRPADFAEIRMQDGELREGMRVLVYDDSCEADGIVDRSQGGWFALVLSETVRNANEQLHAEWLHSWQEYRKSHEKNPEEKAPETFKKGHAHEERVEAREACMKSLESGEKQCESAMLHIFADFNDFPGWRVPLGYPGPMAEIRMQNAQLREGSRVLVYDSTFEAQAILDKFQGCWYAQVRCETVRDANERLHAEWIDALHLELQKMKPDKKNPESN